MRRIWRRWVGSLGGALISAVGVDPLEVRYFLDETHAGRGFATEATHAVFAEAFARFVMARVIAEHFDDNPALGHVLRKLGFAVQ